MLNPYLLLYIALWIIVILLIIYLLFNIKQITYLLNIPSIKEIQNNEIKQLSKRLKGNSIAETLNNTLEWQENNIIYWSERAIDSSMFWFGIFSPIVASLIISLLHFNLDNIWTQLFTILNNYCDYLLIFCGAIIGSLFFKYLMSSSKILDVLKMVLDTLYPLPFASKVLKYKKAVCRDYAKLNITLLSNLFPKSNLYLVTHIMHVAAAIEINGKIYVVDQKLPICELNTWVKRQLSRHKLLWKRYNLYKIIKKGDGFDLQKEKIEKYIDDRVLTEEYVKLDWENIIEELFAAMGSKKSNFKFKLENYAKWYNINDAIIKESLYRYIKNILREGLCGKYSRIRNIEFKQEGLDIVVHLQFM